MRSRTHLETTIISYLTARPSRDLLVAAHQQVTREWWEQRRWAFELFVSQLVIQEASAGDPSAAQQRLNRLAEIPVLGLKQEALVLAKELVDQGAVPDRAPGDALHIALATVHGMDYLLTWNCRHIANAEIRQAVASVCERQGYESPVICTPEELMGG